MGIVFDADGPVNVLQSVKDSIAAADHLEESDAGAVANALAFATRIQRSLDDDNPDRGDKLMYGPMASLAKVLNDLGLTPQGRANLGMTEEAPEEDDF